VLLQRALLKETLLPGIIAQVTYEEQLGAIFTLLMTMEMTMEMEIEIWS
jgi:hypothetical protein